MPLILEEEKYEGGSLKYRETQLDDGFTIVKEAWYPNGQQNYKWNCVNNQRHGLQEA